MVPAPPQLSVVLISRNQEWNIPRLVESVLAGTTCVASREIVLVDSASSDGTVSRASAYPIRILRLHADQRLTPSAGRYVGFRNTSSELVLFLDGDMELCGAWLENALALLRRRGDVAAVSGTIVHRAFGTPGGAEPCTSTPGDERGASEVRFASGTALFRRSVLEQVGPFNPYLFSEEEAELCLRIRAAGYRVLQLDAPVVKHYTCPPSLASLVERWRRNLFLGCGQTPRYFVGSGLLWRYLGEHRYVWESVAGLGLGAASLLAALATGRWLWLAPGAALGTAAAVTHLLRFRDWRRTAYTLVRRALIADGAVRGFLMPPRRPEGYPSRLDVVK